MKALNLLCLKYFPGINPENEIARCISRVTIIRIDIEQISGKEAIELVANHAKTPERHKSGNYYLATQLIENNIGILFATRKLCKYNRNL